MGFSSDSRSNGWSKPDLIRAGLCAAVALLCYANTLHNGLCDDDLPIIAHNPLVTEPGQWGLLWTTDYWHDAAENTPYRDLLYRPLTVLSFRLNHMLHGTEPLGYHLVNIALHAVVTVLLYWFCRRAGGSRAAATTAGVLFAVLPIHTEAVNNIVGRSELLVATFMLAAIALFAARDRTAFVVAGTLCVFGAMCSKETGLAAPLVIPLLDICGIGIQPPRTQVWRWALRRYTGLAAVVVVYLVLRYVALGGTFHQPVTITKTINILVDSGWSERVYGALQLWGLYWAKTVWPKVLCLDYSINALALAADPLHPQVILGTIVLAALIAWCVWSWKRQDRRPVALTVALLLCYFPVSNTVVLIKTSFAERLWYVPSVWAAVIAGGLLVWMFGRLGDIAGDARRRLWRALLVVVVASLAVGGLVRSWDRNLDWRDNGTLYAATYRDHPDAIRALVLYGEWLVNQGDYEPGIELMERALLIDLGFTEAHRRLGQAYLRAGEIDQAFEHLQTAEVQIPNHPPTAAALEVVRRMLAERQAARLSQAEQTADQDPQSLDALIRLADELASVGRNQDAVDRLTAAEDRFADQPVFQHRLAVALEMAGQRDDAVLRYRRAVQLAPNDPTVLIELAMLLMDRRAEGDLAEAHVLADRAEAVAPDRIDVQICRAELLALDGQRAEAAATYRRIEAVLPKSSPLRERCRIRAEWLER